MLERLAAIGARVGRRGGGSRWVMAAAAAVFIIGAIVALPRLGVTWSEIRPWYLVAAAALGVPTAALLAGEYRVSARAVGRSVPWDTAFRVAVMSTAANFLPLPAGALVRVEALHRDGEGRARAFGATLLMAFVWIGLACLVAGVSIAASNAAGALAFGGGAVAAAAVSVWLVRRLSPTGSRLRVAALVVAVESGFVVNSSLRVFLVLRALGIDAGVTAAVVLAVSSVLSAFVAVFPAGLGIRELIAAALAPLVGLDAAAGFLATAVLRLLTIVVFGAMALVMAATPRGDSRSSAADSGPVGPLPGE